MSAIDGIDAEIAALEARAKALRRERTRERRRALMGAMWSEDGGVLRDPAVRAKMSAARKAAWERKRRLDPDLAGLSDAQRADLAFFRRKGLRRAEALAILRSEAAS